MQKASLNKLYFDKHSVYFCVIIAFSSCIQVWILEETTHSPPTEINQIKNDKSRNYQFHSLFIHAQGQKSNDKLRLPRALICACIKNLNYHFRITDCFRCSGRTVLSHLCIRTPTYKGCHWRSFLMTVVAISSRYCCLLSFFNNCICLRNTYIYIYIDAYFIEFFKSW